MVILRLTKEPSREFSLDKVKDFIQKQVGKEENIIVIPKDVEVVYSDNSRAGAFEEDEE